VSCRDTAASVTTPGTSDCHSRVPACNTDACECTCEWCDVAAAVVALPPALADDDVKYETGCGAADTSTLRKSGGAADDDDAAVAAAAAIDLGATDVRRRARMPLPPSPPPVLVPSPRVRFTVELGRNRAVDSSGAAMATTRVGGCRRLLSLLLLDDDDDNDDDDDDDDDSSVWTTTV
jgi:hypothetical protein